MKTPLKNQKKKINYKQKGILTLDFIFALTAVYAISMVFILLALTLMMSTVVQYMSFSMARSHISGDISIEDQQDAVQEKLDQLLGTYLGKFIKTNDEGWFKIETPASASDLIDDPGWGGNGGSERQRPYGVGIRYTSLILKNIRLPLLGSPGDQATGDFASANIYSFMYRQPSTEECLSFNRERWQIIRQRFDGLDSMPNILSDDSGAQADNGC